MLYFTRHFRTELEYKVIDSSILKKSFVSYTLNLKMKLFFKKKAKCTKKHYIYAGWNNEIM